MSTSSSNMVMHCRCGIPCANRTSWIFQNPGRKYVTYKFYKLDSNMRGCGFFMWVDGEMTEWQRTIINNLLNENRSLKSELRQTVKELEEIPRGVDGKKLEELTDELVVLKKKNKRNKIVVAFLFMLICVVCGKIA
ncbi:hypothetical protein RND81_14G063400 [Saponaria officinalis]|uniref:Zinc finger GRF-type domain-containing protein n=1 Tax=Saponaria officinalis TaxID=3572 RepID=A0AAW1GM44_SAPOF